MRYKMLSSTLLLATLPLILGVRIPTNPCPDVFSYYRDERGRIYGEAVVPYDNATQMEFIVNASIVGRYKKSDLTLKMVTGLHELNDYTRTVVYDIFFPFEDIIPKITGITYNGRVYCSGPGEPVVPGTPGITNVWHKITFQFSRRGIGFYAKPDAGPESTDEDLPVKNPGQGKPQLQTPTSSLYPQTPTSPNRPQTPAYPHYPIRTETPPATPPTAFPPRNPTPATPITTSTSLNLDPVNIDNFFTRPTPTPPPTPPTFTSPSVVNNKEFKCGVPNNDPPRNEIVPLIFNSQNTDVGEYPWLVALMIRNEGGQGYNYKCSANLISDNHVLTAARCVQYYQVQIVETEDILLVMGTNTLINWQRSGAIWRKVSNVQSTPEFKKNSNSADGDIAILTMERPVQFSKVLLPVCLWKGNTDLYPFTNKTGVIAGYGQDEEAQKNGQLHAVRLKRANMPIVPQPECLTSPLGFQDLISDKTFCTKSGDTPTGPCIGDSGAGFFIKLNGAFYLRGIASAISTKNDICDLSNQYSVFCDAAKFLDWIKGEML